MRVYFRLLLPGGQPLRRDCLEPFASDVNLIRLMGHPDKGTAQIPLFSHTFVVPRYATMGEYKQYAPANHFHMTCDLTPARLQYWMDLTNVLSLTPWQARPNYIEGVDRPQPLLHLLNAGENQAKQMLARR